MATAYRGEAITDRDLAVRGVGRGKEPTADASSVEETSAGRIVG